MNKYNPLEIERKWREKWEKDKIYSPDLDKAKKPFYNLMMFPYPSAEGMHVGNMYAFAGADVYGRFKRMQGHDVFEPIGLDGFGIHSENYAIKVGKHPAEQAKISEKNFYRQLHAIGNSFDFSRTVETYKPEYYKWTQWIFLKLFEAGLAYKKQAPVNFCPSCKTVLADEQVIEGKCERCGSVVEKRELEQWFFKITNYAERLLANISELNWSEKVKVAQRKWIGRSEGVLIRFKIKDLRFKNEETFIEVFTTRPDTLYGATFLVLSPEHSLVASILEGELEPPKPPRPGLLKLKSYVEEAKKKTEQERAEEKEKTGVFTGLYAINPITNEKIPVWIADYVLMGYGAGAIMAVPAHDQRDFEFAKKFSLPIKEVIKGSGNIAKEAYVGKGEIVNSKEWNGWKTPESIGKVIDWLGKKGIGKKEVNYHLRDWLISRQRYWGPPIPLVFCENCAQKIKNQKSKIKNNEEFSKGELENPGWVAIEEKDLPVKLPEVSDWKPKGTGKSPLASVESFVNTKCPNCGGGAKRETDVSDTFLDSAWYFLRYTSTEFDNVAFERNRVSNWLPVNMYIGGAEHSVLHLLYSRFITMVLYDLKLVGFEEPFERFYSHGLLIKDRAKMSKSKGNVVIPDEYIEKYGADTLRCYLMFLGPFSAGGDFRDSGIEGMYRFLKRVWNLLQKSISNSQFPISNEGKRLMNKTIKKVTEDLENLRYNTAIASLMEWYNFLNEQLTSDKGQLTKEEAETFLKLIAPFAPYMSEELWQQLQLSGLGYQLSDKGQSVIGQSDSDRQKTDNRESVHLQPWPSFDEAFLEDVVANIAVSVNGKTRDVIKYEKSKIKNQKVVEQLAMESAKVKKYLEGKKILKTIYVEGKIINFVTQ